MKNGITVGLIIRRILLLSLLIGAITSRFTFCQNNPVKNNTNKQSLNTKSKGIHLSDSLLTVFSGNLFLNLIEKSQDAFIRFSSSADSISQKVNGDLLSDKEDSLKLLRTLLHTGITAYTDSFRQKLDKIPVQYAEKVKSFKQISFADVSDASDTLSIIKEEFKDAMTSAVDDYYDNLNDLVDNALDSLGNYAESLIDNQNEENDRLDSQWDNYYTYGLFGKIGYTSDMQYQGYKGDVTQNAFIPGLFYHHPIGLGALINAYNIKGTTVPWDEIELGISYSRSFTDNLYFGISYTHYVFYDTTEIAKQGINGIAGVSLSYDFSLLSVGTSFDVSFAEQTDYSFSISFSKRIDLIKKPSFHGWFEPDLSAVYGTQTFLNEKIVNKSKGKGNNGKGNGNNMSNIISTTSHVLSVLDYQFTFPLNIQVGRFIITPQFIYVIPMNQPSNTDSNAFGFFTINVSAKIF
jgi:hypothetical protein